MSTSSLDANPPTGSATVTPSTTAPTMPKTTPRRPRVFYVLAAVCLAPIVASYLAYYVLPPTARTNYGDLIEPQRAVSTVAASTLDKQPVTFSSLQGSWLMVQVAPARCDEACRQHLWTMRQVRATTGKERDRVTRVWLVTDQENPDAALLRDFEGTLLWRISAADLQALFGAEANVAAEHLWLIDPLGNLMLRWPREADPSRMKKDLGRVLRASGIG